MRTVRHRWRVPLSEQPPLAGEIIVGARKAWRVVEVVPIESPIHPNDFRGTLAPIDWKPGDPADRWYAGGRFRVFHGPWCASTCTHDPVRDRAPWLAPA